MSGHTPGQLKVTPYGDDYYQIDDSTGYQVSEAYGENDARRLVACWNACEGISNQFLDECTEKYTRPIKDLFLDFEAKEKELTAQRDELLAALKLLCSRIEVDGATPMDSVEYSQAIAAIAKITGESNA